LAKSNASVRLAWPTVEDRRRAALCTRQRERCTHSCARPEQGGLLVRRDCQGAGKAKVTTAGDSKIYWLSSNTTSIQLWR